MNDVAEMARAMKKSEQFVRIAIQKGLIPNCFYLVKDGATRGSYYIPREVIKSYEQANKD